MYNLLINRQGKLKKVTKHFNFLCHYYDIMSINFSIINVRNNYAILIIESTKSMLLYICSMFPLFSIVKSAIFLLVTVEIC